MPTEMKVTDTRQASQRIEQRRVQGELRVDGTEEGSGGDIIGFISYNVETVIGGRFREVIRPGFFRDVGQQDIVAWYQHGEGGQPVLGRTSAGTLRFEDTPEGLRWIASPPNRPWVEDLKANIIRGEVDASSFAFEIRDTDGERWSDDTTEGKLPLRELLRGAIWDMAPVVFAAYPKTSLGTRSAEQVLEDHIRSVRPADEPENQQAEPTTEPDEEGQYLASDGEEEGNRATGAELKNRLRRLDLVRP